MPLSAQGQHEKSVILVLHKLDIIKLLPHGIIMENLSTSTMPMQCNAMLLQKVNMHRIWFKAHVYCTQNQFRFQIFI